MIDDGVAVLDARGDVTISEDVRRVIETASQQMPPLAGVIHGAMVLDDRFIADLDQASFSKVMDPKVLGAWNLHLATRDLPLDHFICFSSFSNIIGGAKQSNYNAGNLFLDALAHHRRGSGLPALTINWSALSGAGFVERNEMTAKYLDKLGMKSLSLSEAFDVLRRMLSRDPVQVAACRADWQALARLSPLVATSNTFQAMIQSQRGVDSGGSLRPRLLAAMPEQRVALLTEFVTQQVADVFGVDPARIDPDASLTHLGLDSLMAIDLINRIESELSASLPMGSVLRGPSLKELAEILVALVGDATNQAGDEGREAGLTSGSPVPLERSLTRQDEFPLSAGQQSLWFLYRLAPTSSAYNLTFAAKFTPHVDLELMEQAFGRVLSQHPMLNVTFSDSGGLPVQRLTRGGELDYREHDASDLSKTDLDDRLMQCACEPFDLENGPVIRLDMFRLADGHLALMSMHHIVSDAWSVTVLIRDLLESYFTLRPDGSRNCLTSSTALTTSSTGSSGILPVRRDERWGSTGNVTLSMRPRRLNCQPITPVRPCRRFGAGLMDLSWMQRFLIVPFDLRLSRTSRCLLCCFRFMKCCFITTVGRMIFLWGFPWQDASTSHCRIRSATSSIRCRCGAAFPTIRLSSSS